MYASWITDQQLTYATAYRYEKSNPDSTIGKLCSWEERTVEINLNFYQYIICIGQLQNSQAVHFLRSLKQLRK